MHSPACLTWRVHLRRCLSEREAHVSLKDFLDDVLHSWDNELLCDDPEFLTDLDRMIAETRASMDQVPA